MREVAQSLIYPVSWGLPPTLLFVRVCVCRDDGGGEGAQGGVSAEGEVFSAYSLSPCSGLLEYNITDHGIVQIKDLFLDLGGLTD